MTYYTHYSHMVAPHYVWADVPSYNPSDSKDYWAHCSKMASPHYVYVDVSWEQSSDWMIYYTHSRQMSTRHQVQIPVHSVYSAKREEITWKILLRWEMSLKSKYSMRLSGKAWVGDGEVESVRVWLCAYHYVYVSKWKAFYNFIMKQIKKLNNITHL
jgi:hypothetical protein